MAKFDIYQEVTDQILTTIEDGTPAWRKPWSGGACSRFPTRANDELYNGINVLMLWASAHKKEFKSNYWMTFKQARELGGAVRKGEKSTRVIYYGTIEKEDQPEAIPYIKTYAVFNATQIDDLTADYYPASVQTYNTTLDAKIMQRFNAFPIDVRLSKKLQAAYNPSSDFVEMPPVENFKTENGYYATLAHELCHATGHKKRLDRAAEKLAYGFEELVAEIGACMVCARLGIEPNFKQSAAYIEHWQNILTADKKAIFRAASKAQKACDYVLDHLNVDQEKAVA